MTVLRCPDSVAPETRNVTGGEFSVGRGPGVDWVLPDPERLLSKRHFAVAFRGGSGSSPTPRPTAPFSTARTPRSAPATCATCMTAIGCASAPTRSRCVWWRTTTRVRVARRPTVRLPIRSRWIRSRQPRPQRNPFDEPDHLRPRIPPTSAQLPHDFDPLAPDPHETPFRGPTQADNSPVMQDAFRLPAHVGQIAAARRRHDSRRRPAAGRLGQGSAGGHLPAGPAPAPVRLPVLPRRRLHAQGAPKAATCRRTRRTGRRTATSGRRPRAARRRRRSRNGRRRRRAARGLPRGRRPAGCPSGGSAGDDAGAGQGVPRPGRRPARRADRPRRRSRANSASSRR